MRCRVRTIGIQGPVERQAVLNQPFREIGPGNGANRDGALVLVAINFNTFHGAARDEGVKIVRSYLSAVVVLAASVPAELIGLRRVNAP